MKAKGNRVRRRAAIVAAFVVLVLVTAARSGSHTRTGASEPRGAPLAGMPFAVTRERASFDGAAREVLQVPGYTYVAVDVDESVDEDLRWVASLHKDIAPGSRLRVRSFGVRRGFESRQLGRTFPELHFGVLTVVDRTPRPTERNKP